MNFHASNAVEHAGVVSHRKLIDDDITATTPFVNKGCPRNQREIGIVHGADKVRRVNHRIVGRRAKLLTGCLPDLKSTRTRVERIGKIGASLLITFLACRWVSKVNTLAESDFVIALSRGLTGIESGGC